MFNQFAVKARHEEPEDSLEEHADCKGIFRPEVIRGPSPQHRSWQIKQQNDNIPSQRDIQRLQISAIEKKRQVSRECTESGMTLDRIVEE